MLTLEIARSVLENAGYDTHLDTKRPQLIFEDPNIFGFVSFFDDIPSILTSWRSEQDRFVRANTPALSRVPTKAWNIYAIFITKDDCTDENLTALLNIEEDLQGARKIVGAGVRTESTLTEALAPILPLRSAFTVDNSTPQDRLLNDPSVGPRLLSLLEDKASDVSLAAFFEEVE